MGAETRPQPLREFKNLQTPIDCLHFGPHAEALAMGSADVEGALRLVGDQKANRAEQGEFCSSHTRAAL